MDENIELESVEKGGLSTEAENALKEKATEVIEKIRTQALLTGARAMTVTIANMIDAELNKPGKRTMADMRRIIKQVRKFCQTAIDHPVEEPKFEEEE